ncbi:hypothetical protein KC19_VG333000 [Ceratodon purpureus]|uniref:Uncharacterized protein n=1 Tax=Ceratodon purpureus TaxID=3225 RepID=A0A8T0HX22_CERPU|nr:hypothetical protein KC19_VG333000 [Ceratodon purpureus]
MTETLLILTSIASGGLLLLQRRSPNSIFNNLRVSTLSLPPRTKTFLNEILKMVVMHALKLSSVSLPIIHITHSHSADLNFDIEILESTLDNSEELTERTTDDSTIFQIGRRDIHLQCRLLLQNYETYPLSLSADA